MKCFLYLINEKFEKIGFLVKFEIVVEIMYIEEAVSKYCG